MSKNPKSWWKLMKIGNIAREILYNYGKTWVISMKFSGKMCLMIILKVTKNCGFTLSLEDTIFEKPQGGGGQFDKKERMQKKKQNFFSFGYCKMFSLSII